MNDAARAPMTIADAPCLVCGGPLAGVLDGVFDTRFGIDRFYRVDACSRCGLEQTRPLPSPSELKALYEDHYNFGGERNTAYTRWRQSLFDSVLYRVWMALDGDVSFHGRRGRGRLLDIGCNEGRGLRLYRANGFEAEGLELNESAAARAREAGFRVSTDLLENFHPAAPYDAAVLSNVLEHALDPGEMLGHVRRLLAEGGRVWISLPNASSFQRSLFGKSWINWHAPFHITHFTRAGLEDLLRRKGFVVEECGQVSPALWAAQSFLAFLFARKGRPTRQLRSPLLVPGLVLLVRGVLFPVLWLGNLLGRGDCLKIVARKDGA